MKIISGNQYIRAKENLFIDKVNLNDFLENGTTPIMIFIKNRILDNIKNFNEVFHSTFDNFEFFYSYKANFLQEVVDIISSQGVGAEVISLLELKLALRNGVNPQNILVGGPYLPSNLIKKCLSEKVKEIVVYNISDLERINQIAIKNNQNQKICLRVNSNKYESKLGISLTKKNLKSLEKLSKTCRNLEIETILSHFGTQMNSAHQFKQNITAVANAYNNLKEIGIRIKNLNLGGGFPEATVMPKTQLKKVSIQIRDQLKNLDLSYEKIYFEPGRYLVGDAALFLSKVVSADKNNWIFLDIGNHICPRFARCSLRFYNASRIQSPHKYKKSIAGIIPTDQDVLAKDYFMTKKIKRGDIFLITNVGAYTLTFSNRFPYRLPYIFIVNGEEMNTIFDPTKDKDFSLS